MSGLIFAAYVCILCLCLKYSLQSIQFFSLCTVALIYFVSIVDDGITYLHNECMTFKDGINYKKKLIFIGTNGKMRYIFFN
jgi:hypothetical protein